MTLHENARELRRQSELLLKAADLIDTVIHSQNGHSKNGHAIVARAAARFTTTHGRPYVRGPYKKHKKYQRVPKDLMLKKIITLLARSSQPLTMSAIARGLGRSKAYTSHLRKILPEIATGTKPRGRNVEMVWAPK
jgi:hypothetical protein